MIVELKSDALKERHWKQLMRKLRVNWVLSDLTLGQVWDVDLQSNEVVVKEIILTAQGEMALEEFLRQVSRVLACSSFTHPLWSYIFFSAISVCKILTPYNLHYT